MAACCLLCPSLCCCLDFSPFFGLFFRLLTSYRAHNRAGKAMSSSINKFGNFGLRMACFCMQGVQIVEYIGVENWPWALGIALICHFWDVLDVFAENGLEKAVFCVDYCCRSCNGWFCVVLWSWFCNGWISVVCGDGPVMVALLLFKWCCCCSIAALLNVNSLSMNTASLLQT